MKDSKIEWCDHTFNPWIGCTKVSPGCAHCYAEALNVRWKKGANWGKGAPRQRTSDANWKLPLRWDHIVNFSECWKCGRRGVSPKAGDPCPACGAVNCHHATRQRVFCASLADWLDEEVPIEWLGDLLQVIYSTENLDWLLLTKRPENWSKRLHDYVAKSPLCGGLDWDVSLWLDGEAPPNLWIGTTTENQADNRIPELLQIPARVRFLSVEPMQSEIDLGLLRSPTNEDYRGWDGDGPIDYVQTDRHGKIHWVICGGESGPGARPMHPDWARSLRNQCQSAGVPFFFKQWGEWEPVTPIYRGRDEKEEDGRGDLEVIDRAGHVWEEHEGQPSDMQSWLIERVGKKASGRLLDGREWNEVPQ